MSEQDQRIVSPHYAHDVIFEEKMTLLTRTEFDCLTAERDLWQQRATMALGRQDIFETWSGRWKDLARRYRAMLRAHRDRDIPDLAAARSLAESRGAEVAELREALQEQWEAAHDDRCGALAEICIASPIGCVWKRPSALGVGGGEPSGE